MIIIIIIIMAHKLKRLKIPVLVYSFAFVPYFPAFMKTFGVTS